MTGTFRNVKTGHEWSEKPAMGVRGYLTFKIGSKGKGEEVFFHTVGDDGFERHYKVTHYDFYAIVLSDDAVTRSIIEKGRRRHILCPKPKGRLKSTPAKDIRFCVMRYCGATCASFRTYGPKSSLKRRDFTDYDLRYNMIKVEIAEKSAALFDPKNFDGESTLDYTSYSMCHTKVSEGVYDSTYDASRLLGRKELQKLARLGQKDK